MGNLRLKNEETQRSRLQMEEQSVRGNYAGREDVERGVQFDRCSFRTSGRETCHCALGGEFREAHRVKDALPTQGELAKGRRIVWLIYNHLLRSLSSLFGAEVPGGFAAGLR